MSSPLLAQGYYYGAVDDVYPIGLEVASDTVAWAWIGSATRAVRFAGRPSQNGRVKWRALDTTLVLDGTLREGDFVGTLRNGSGREQSVLAKAYAGQRSTLSVPFRGQTTTPTPKARQWVTEAARQLGIGRTQDTTFVKTAAELPADFLTFCGSQKWVSTWTTATRDYRLTLTLLPTGRLRGSLFLAASQTTLLADGEARGSTLSVVLSQLNHETVGTLEAAADERVDDWGRLTAKLDLGAGGQTLRFALSERIPLECRQEGGSLDLLLPRIGRDDRPNDGPPAAQSNDPGGLLRGSLGATALGRTARERLVRAAPARRLRDERLDSRQYRRRGRSRRLYGRSTHGDGRRGETF